jgi:DNA-directed RNA polymerase specialized sigma subunit
MVSDELLNQHRGLIGSIVKSYRGKGLSDDDLFQEGMIGLIKAAIALIRAKVLNSPAMPFIGLESIFWRLYRGNIATHWGRLS